MVPKYGHASIDAVAGTAIIVGMLWCASARAAQIHVPDDYASIQGAIDVASDGDEIIVSAGTYTENIDLSGKAITLRSTDPTDPAVVTSTIIDGDGDGSVIECEDGEGPETVISGFVVTGGNSPYGGGLYFSGTSPTVSYCTFSNNQAYEYGGAVCAMAAYPSLADCTFINNNSLSDGGAVFAESGSITLTACTFIGNTSDGSGGAIDSSYSDIVVTDCTFTGNSAEIAGGAICQQSYASSIGPALTRCSFTNNSAQLGGGVYLTIGEWSLTDCRFTGNSAGTGGGGLYTYGFEGIVDGCTFIVNYSLKSGGGMVCDGGNTTVTGCRFTGNAAGFNYGGGGAHVQGGPPTIANSVICGNLPDQILGSYSDGGGNAVSPYAAPPPPLTSDDCPGDTNNDGVVDIDDVFVVLASWGPCE